MAMRGLRPTKPEARNQKSVSAGHAELQIIENTCCLFFHDYRYAASKETGIGTPFIFRTAKEIRDEATLTS